MTFTPKSWGNFASGGTPLNAAALVDLETRVTAYTDAQIPLVGDATIYVSGSGDNANDGLTSRNSKRTLAAAYSALPSTGGTIIANPGRYDVGTGFALTRNKPIYLRGAVRPPSFIPSTTLVPLSYNCAIIYSSGNPVSLITTIGGTASDRCSGCRIENILFELSGTNTMQAIDADTCVHWEVTENYFFADKITGPSPITVRAIWCHWTGSYADNDASWWRVWHNRGNNVALATFGDPVNIGNNNQNVVYANVMLGLDQTNTGTRPCISFYGAHRCSTRDNNIESYDRGILLDHAFQCNCEADGGEYVKYFIDVGSSQGNKLAPLGPSWSAAPTAPTPPTPHVAGSRLVRGDIYSYWNVIILPGVGTSLDQYSGLFRPTDDATEPAIELGNVDNIVISPRFSTDPMRVGGTFTSTPGAVSTVSIPHSMSTFQGGANTIPAKFSAQPANLAAATALTTRSMYVTADATSVILNFAPALAAATSYAWAWRAEAR